MQHTWQNGGSKTKLVSVLGRRPDVHVFNLRSFPKVLFLSWKFKKMVTWKVVKQSLQSVIWAIITWPLAWNSTMSCFNIMQTKIHSAVLKAFHSAFRNSPKKFSFREVVQSTQWFEQILPQKPRNSTMLCFNTFQTKIHSAVLKAFCSVFGNSPKKFWFWEVVQSTQWFEQILPH